MQHTAQCKGNKKTMHLAYHSIKRAEKLEPNLVRIVFKARVRMFGIKVNYKSKYYKVPNRFIQEPGSFVHGSFFFTLR